MVVDVHRLIERVLKIEAGGEEVVCEEALRRILARLEALADEPQEFQFTLTSSWSQKLFVALAQRYGLKPFRRRRQHSTTIMVSAKRRFIEDTFMPQFNAIHGELVKHFDEIAQTIIEKAVYRDPVESREVEVQAPSQLRMPVG